MDSSKEGQGGRASGQSDQSNVLVHRGCYNRHAIETTEMVDLYTTELYSSGGWKSGISWLPAWSVLVRALFWVTDCRFFLESSYGREQRERQEASSLMTLIMALILFVCDPSTLRFSSNPNYLPKAPPPNTTALCGRGFWYMNFGEMQYSVHDKY